MDLNIIVLILTGIGIAGLSFGCGVPYASRKPKQEISKPITLDETTMSEREEYFDTLELETVKMRGNYGIKALMLNKIRRLRQEYLVN